MDTQLDLSIAATIKDPDLRASLERLGTVMKDTPSRSRARAAISSQDHPVPLFPKLPGRYRATWPGVRSFRAFREGSPFHQGRAAGDR